MYFHFFTVVGRQPDCRLKSKNPSVLSAFSVQNSLKRVDFCLNKAQNRRHTAVWRRFLTQFRRKYAVLNHIGSPHLKVRRAEHNMPKNSYYGVFSLFTVVGRQHDCRLKSKNPSVLSAFSVQSSLKREDFCPTRYKIAAILPYGKIFNAVQAKICRFKPYRLPSP